MLIGGAGSRAGKSSLYYSGVRRRTRAENSSVLPEEGVDDAKIILSKSPEANAVMPLDVLGRTRATLTEPASTPLAGRSG